MAADGSLKDPVLWKEKDTLAVKMGLVGIERGCGSSFFHEDRGLQYFFVPHSRARGDGRALLCVKRTQRGVVVKRRYECMGEG